MLEKSTLKKRQFSLSDIPSPLVAFFMTAIALVGFFAISGTAPLGRNAFLLSDLGAQYAPKLVAYKDHLLSDGLLSYSFQNGMGKNVWGVFGYYLSSPFNLITFLFPAKWIAQAVVIMIILKLSFAGAFMSFFLETRSKKKDKSSVLFALLYVFSTYSIIYMMHIMWLDGFLMLPLVLVMAEKYMKDRRKWIQLVICLTILFISGYYIAYMVGIFSFLYVLGRSIEKKSFSSKKSKETAKMIAGFIGCAFLASGLSMWYLLPAGLDTLSHPDFTGRPFEHTTMFAPLQALDQFFIGAGDILDANKPLLFAGMITNIFVVLFFLHPKISYRRKCVAGGALFFFFLSFIYTGLVRFWHLFDDPNWFFHRQSFLAVFVLVALAYNAFIRRDQLEKKHLVKCGCIILSVLVFVASFGDIRSQGERFFINLFFPAIMLVLVWGLITKRWPQVVAGLKKYAIYLLVFVVVIEMVFINSLAVRVNADLSLPIKYEAFSNEYNDMKFLRDYAGEKRENDVNNFYRMEVDYETLYMSNLTAGHYLNYPSVSVFQSVSNKQVNRFLKQLGMQVNHNYFYTIHSYNSVPVDSFLGIEYLIAHTAETGGLLSIKEIQREEKAYYLLQNEGAFPLLFPVKSSANDYDFYRLERNEYDKNYFVFQNEWWTSLFASFEEAEIFYPAHIEGPYLSNAFVAESKSIEEKMHIQRQDDLGLEPREGPRDIETQFLRINSNANMNFEYKITVETTDPLYFSLPMWDNDMRGRIFLEDEPLRRPALGFFTEIIELGTFEPGDVLTLRFEAFDDCEMIGIIDAHAYHCDMDLFVSSIDQTEVHRATQELDVENGHVQATLKLEEDALVLTTIPYEKGWALRVNGEQYDIISYQDAFISFPLDEGYYDIELTFRAPGLREGIVVSLVTLLVFVSCVTIKCLNRGKNDGKTKENS